MVSIGIDIGTTTICAVMAEVHSGEIIKSITAKNSFFIETENTFERLQDAEKIAKTAANLILELRSCRKDIVSIGVTGQMHGIVYVNQDGVAVSPLYTWQDGRGNLEYKDSTYSDVLSKITNSHCAIGFGLTTHFYNIINNLVPKEAFKLCTIQDYVGARLTKAMPVLHISNAASLGVFNVETLDFDFESLKAAKIESDILPPVISEFKIIGNHLGIPVCVAVGDNQASFLGSVNSTDCVLVNVGTGSQVSVISGAGAAPENTEIRPLYGNKNLLVGSSLCGGRAYALLADFFKQCANCFGVSEGKNIYKIIDDIATKGIAENGNTINPVTVSTKFSGTRQNPGQRGSIGNIGTDNFTVQSFILGTLSGMEQELHEMYSAMAPLATKKAQFIVGSGNGIRKNAPLRALIESRFGLPLVMPSHLEEASFGAMLCSLTACGVYSSIEQSQQEMIKYNKKAE